MTNATMQSLGEDHQAEEKLRNLTFMATPEAWPMYPFLPLVRRTGSTDGPDLGLLIAGEFRERLPSLATTVVLACVFTLPSSWEGFLSLPRESHGSVEDIYAAGWRVD